jgi:YVTN family beta-propeller protein
LKKNIHLVNFYKKGGVVKNANLYRLFFMWFVSVFTWGQIPIEAVNYPEAWVCDMRSNGVTTIDLDTRTTVGSPVSVGHEPLGIAITPDNRYAWVTNYNSNTVTTIDLNTRTTVGSPVPVGHGPYGIAITPDNMYAWVANQDDNTVTTIDLNTRTTVGSPVPVGNMPNCIAITPDNRYAWVVNWFENTVTTIDLNTRTTVDSPVTVGAYPHGIAITPDNRYAWVTSWAYDTVTTIDLNTRTIVGSPVHVGESPVGIAITSDNRYAWVTNQDDNTVTTIDLNTRTTVGSPVHVGNGPNGIAITPDNKYAWVANEEGGTVTTIDLNTRTTVGSPVSVGSGPYMIAISPDQAPTAQFSSTVHEMTVVFDASESTSPYGEIASYQWDFGDGSAVETMIAPTISHTYVDNGTYTVTLTVTNTSGTSTRQIFTGQTVSNNGGPTAEIQRQVTLDSIVIAPRDFHGKAKIYKKSKKLFLRTKWEKSTSSNLIRYEIFAHKKRIAIIPVRKPQKKRLHLHPQHFPYHNLSKHYKHYLQSKYTIRAIDSHEKASDFTPLHITKSAGKSFFNPS